MPIFGSKFAKLGLSIAYGSVLVAVCLFSAEFAARLDDWLYAGVPLLASPEAEKDLIVVDDHGRRGRPHGLFKKWKLNAFGFRAPEINREPLPNQIRVVILGASEAFGLYESNGMEFPAQLQKTLANETSKVEIVNAAIVGMKAKSMLGYWKSWLKQFNPDIVLIYPSPLFYLVESRQSLAIKVNVNSGARSSFHFESRFVERLKDVVDFPAVIQRWRTQRNIAKQVEGRLPEWFFGTVPEERLRQFNDDVLELSVAIRGDGACPILITHAIRVSALLHSADIDEVQSAREHVPRALPRTILAFEAAAADSIRKIGRAYGFPIIDAASVMNGRRNWFGDFVHFSDEGASFLAELIAKRIRMHIRYPRFCVTDSAVDTRSSN
jgi:hypothetical protein